MRVWINLIVYGAAFAGLVTNAQTAAKPVLSVTSQSADEKFHGLKSLAVDQIALPANVLSKVQKTKGLPLLDSTKQLTEDAGSSSKDFNLNMMGPDVAGGGDFLVMNF